jgi:hypothetical protein
VRDWKKHLAIWLFFGLLVGIMALPAPFSLSTHLIGNNVDNWIFYWNDWWLETALAENHSPLFTPYLFFPYGASLAAHSNSFLSSALALPLRPLVGPVAASNLVWFFGLWIGAVGMFWLTYSLTRNSAGALIAGFVFTFGPYHLSQALAHAHLGSIQWWPWYALYLHRALSQGSKRAAIGAGFFAALTLWTGLQLTIMLALWTALYLIAVFARRRHPLHPKLSTQLAAILLTGAVLTLLSLPLLVPILRNWQNDWTANFSHGESQQTDLLAYLVPPTYHPLWGDTVQPVYKRFIANRASMAYLGYIPILLTLIAIFAPIRGRHSQRSRPTGWPAGPGFWAIVLALWVLLAAGNALRVNGVLYTTIQLPYKWIENVFPISTIRSPDRFNLLTTLSLAALAGYGATWIARRRRWLLLPIGLMLLTEYLSLPLLRWELLPDSPFYEQMAQEPPDYGVISYPLGYDEAKLWLYYQTRHGKPVVEGHVSRYSPELYSLITSNSLTRALYQGSVAKRPDMLPADVFMTQPVPLPDLGPALRELTGLRIRYVLIHKPYVNWEQHYKRVFPFAPVYEDETLAVYDLTAPLAVTYDGFPIALSDDLLLARFDVQNPTPDVWAFQILVQLRRDSPGAPFPCTLALRDDAREWIHHPFVLFDAADSTIYATGDLDVKEIAVPVETVLPPSEYHWRLTCDGASYQPVEQLVIADGEALYTRPTSPASFDAMIALAGYHWRTSGNMLRIDFWWDVERAPVENYKRFVHVLAPDGALVAQYDTFPCAWACPTSEWEAGQRIHDGAELQLWNLPPGQYRIALGWYHADTYERLGATGADGNPIADGYVYLEDVFVIQRQ